MQRLFLKNEIVFTFLCFIKWEFDYDVFFPPPPKKKEKKIQKGPLIFCMNSIKSPSHKKRKKKKNKITFYLFNFYGKTK